MGRPKSRGRKIVYYVMNRGNLWWHYHSKVWSVLDGDFEGTATSCRVMYNAHKARSHALSMGPDFYIEKFYRKNGKKRSIIFNVMRTQRGRKDI